MGKKTQQTGPGKGSLLDPCPKNSLFAVKIWKNDGFEFKRYSKDFELERLQFAASKDIFFAQFSRIGHPVFGDFNGFRKITEFLQKLDKQGQLKHAEVYCNQIRQPNPKISFDPVPIRIASYPGRDSHESAA